MVRVPVCLVLLVQVDVCFGDTQFGDLHRLDAHIDDDLVTPHEHPWNVVWRQWSVVESRLVVSLFVSVVWLAKRQYDGPHTP